MSLILFKLNIGKSYLIYCESINSNNDLITFKYYKIFYL